jgi:hypothetical protein
MLMRALVDRADTLAVEDLCRRMLIFAERDTLLHNFIIGLAFLTLCGSLE